MGIELHLWIEGKEKPAQRRSVGARVFDLLLISVKIFDRPVRQDVFASAPITPKLEALLAIAGKVQQDGKRVSADDIVEAKAHGATDIEIHDTVLIAAASASRSLDGKQTPR
ncbi:MAG TPA: hypothetical protein VME23_20340 [Terracidiphilus sp.]|nr:hypothetical protein [Terracidiphilus sp.]